MPSIKRAVAEQQLAEMANEEAVNECFVCFGQKDIDEMMQNPVCCHIMCRTCVSRLERRVCPQPACKAPLPVDWPGAPLCSSGEQSVRATDDLYARAADANVRDDETVPLDDHCAVPTCRVALEAESSFRTNWKCDHLVCYGCVETLTTRSDGQRACPHADCVECDGYNCERVAPLAVPVCDHRFCLECAERVILLCLQDGTMPSCSVKDCGRAFSRQMVAAVRDNCPASSAACDNLLDFFPSDGGDDGDDDDEPDENDQLTDDDTQSSPKASVPARTQTKAESSSHADYEISAYVLGQPLVVLVYMSADDTIGGLIAKAREQLPVVNPATLHYHVGTVDVPELPAGRPRHDLQVEHFERLHMPRDADVAVRAKFPRRDGSLVLDPRGDLLLSLLRSHA